MKNLSDNPTYHSAVAQDAIRALFPVLGLHVSGWSEAHNLLLRFFRIALAINVNARNSGLETRHAVIAARDFLEAVRPRAFGASSAASVTAAGLTIAARISTPADFNEDPAQIMNMRAYFDEALHRARNPQKKIIAGPTDERTHVFAMPSIVVNSSVEPIAWNNPIWRDGSVPKEVRVDFERFEQEASRTESDWSFWHLWLIGALIGEPVDWNVQFKVASIADTLWEAGPEAIAAEIRRIEQEVLSEKVSLKETLHFNDQSGRFFVTSQYANKPDLLTATLSQVTDALDDVLADHSNGLNDRSREVRVLQRTAIKHGNDPQRVEMDFTSVHTGLVRQIAVEDLPPSEANLALARALEEGAQAIRATHQEIADNRRILEAQKIAELSDKQKADLAEALPVLEDISEGIMQDDFIADISFLTSESVGLPVGAPSLGAADRNPVLAGYDEKRRTFARIAQIAIILRKFPKLIHKIDGSATYKAAKILTTIAALVTIGIALF